jgi:hypothetical protein
MRARSRFRLRRESDGKIVAVGEVRVEGGPPMIIIYRFLSDGRRDVPGNIARPST